MANSKVSNRVSLARASTKAATNTARSKTPAIVHAVPPSILLLDTAFNWTGAFDSTVLDLISSWAGVCFAEILGRSACSDVGTDWRLGCSDLRTSNAGSNV